MVEEILVAHAAEMDQRRAVIRAISELSPDERAQLLLYLLGDDWAATDVMDGGRWRYQEYVPWPTGRGLPEVATPTRSVIPPVPEGEGRTL